MGTRWLMPFTAALMVYSPVTAKKYVTRANEFSPNHNGFDQSPDLVDQVPPPPPPSIFAGFPPNDEDPKENNSYESGMATQSALYGEKQGLPASQNSMDGTGSNSNVLPSRRLNAAGISDLPIHYDFPAASTSEEDTNRVQQFSSARRDKITAYMSSTVGKIQVVCSASLIGGGSFLFLAKSIIPFATNLMGTLGVVVFFFGSFFRTPFGELVRALGLSLILVLQRTSNVRKRYPTWPYVRAAIGATKRNVRPFPPSRNLWTYEARRAGDANFSMLYSIVAMGLVGSFCGGSLPIITWIGSLLGCFLCGFGCVLQSPLGSLCRTMGMRIVALLQELWNVQTDLRIIPKAAVVTSQVIDKMMVFDRKHRVKDRFLSLVTRAYDQVTQSTSQMQDSQEIRKPPRPTSRHEDDMNM